MVMCSVGVDGDRWPQDMRGKRDPSSAGCEDRGGGIVRGYGLRSGRRRRGELAGVPWRERLRLEADRVHAYWLFTLVLEPRGGVRLAARSGGRPVPVVDVRIHRNSLFGGMSKDLLGQTEFDLRQIALLVHEGLDDEDVGRIVDHVKSGW